MIHPITVFDLDAELSDELIAAIALVLLPDDGPDADSSPRRIPDARTGFRNPRGWR
ncbi:hypothetical protein ACFXHA_13780 [Nocardia sp. NPDC059240]|uniref:hypothetical protein n=1 Tax=Nocardia sp. NPDC059240 TaxID=3346786 RepID=UPI0036A472C6